MVQRYEDDLELADYFSTPAYAMAAMYVSVFGASEFVESMVGKTTNSGRILHDAHTIIRDTDLLAPGIERGVNPYGGYGYAASSN